MNVLISVFACTTLTRVHFMMCISSSNLVNFVNEFCVMKKPLIQIRLQTIAEWDDCNFRRAFAALFRFHRCTAKREHCQVIQIIDTDICRWFCTTSSTSHRTVRGNQQRTKTAILVWSKFSRNKITAWRKMSGLLVSVTGVGNHVRCNPPPRLNSDKLILR